MQVVLEGKSMPYQKDDREIQCHGVVVKFRMKHEKKEGHPERKDAADYGIFQKLFPLHLADLKDDAFMELSSQMGDLTLLAVLQYKKRHSHSFVVQLFVKRFVS